MTKKLKILYIVGSARSGSTLLSRLLGEVDGFFNAGEAARYLLAPYESISLPCGCGNKLSKCSFWKDIVSIVPSSYAKSIAKRIMRIRYYPLLISLFRQKKIQSQLIHLGKELKDLYSKIALKADCEVIVDSSKTPDFAYILSQFSDIELYMLHLIRKPQGVANSWRKPKQYLRSQSVMRISMGWLIDNLTIELLLLKKIRYQRVFYENLTQNPKNTLDKIIKFLKVKDRNLDFIKESQAVIHNQHMLASNPDKLKENKSISINFCPWKLPLLENFLVTIVVFPLLIKYYFLPGRSKN